MHSKSLGIAAPFVVIASVSAADAIAADFTIPAGVTVTSTQALGNDETGLVEPEGAISTGFGPAISAGDGNTITNYGLAQARLGPAIIAGSDNTLTNDGTISASFGPTVVVLSGNTITNNGTIFSPSWTGIQAVSDNVILNRGTISTNGYYSAGIEALDNNTITNDGTISTTGHLSDGINVWDNNRVVNNGEISTSGIFALGIYARADANVTNNGFIKTLGDESQGIGVGSGIVTNAGTISTSGHYADGIYNGYGSVTNNGSISTTGFDSNGIKADFSEQITNNGDIKTSGIWADGIHATYYGSVTNNGRIEISGGSSNGILLGSGEVDNTGTIVASGPYATGITVENLGNVTNAGTILATGENSRAISFLYGDGSLSLLAGSRTAGLISLGFGAHTVNLARGENWAISFDPAGSPADVVNTFGATTAFLNGGYTVVTFDAAHSVFGQEDDALDQLTSGIRDGLHYRLTAGNPAPYLWVQGLGGARDTDTSGLTPESRIRYAGVMAGFSAPLAPGTRGGLFTGWAEGKRELATGTHEVDTENFFGGAYGRAFLGAAFADLIVTAGTSSSDSERRVLDNLSPSGVAYATGSYDGWFVNPEVTLGAEIPVASLTVVPSASIGYAGLFLEGLHERGSIATVALAGRDIHLIDGRVQIEVRNAWQDAAGSWRTAGRTGIKGRANIGDGDLTGVLATTTAFTIDVEDNDSVVGGFLGADVTYYPAPNMQLFFGGEAVLESTGDTGISGRAGAALKF